MIKIFYGNDRVKAREMIDKLLGKDYEVIEAENLTRGDMDSVFYGTSLFGETRKILVKSLSENIAPAPLYNPATSITSITFRPLLPAAQSLPISSVSIGFCQDGSALRRSTTR